MKRYLNFLVVAISVATVISGIIQTLFPGFVLGRVGGETTPSTSHFFAIIGMFMFLFGGLMLQNVYAATPDRRATLWCALQKIGACMAVLAGVYNHLFSTIAIGVALFDLFSGIVFFYYRKSLKPDEGR